MTWRPGRPIPEPSRSVELAAYLLSLLLLLACAVVLALI